jgi:hypothetical protein
LEGAKKREEMKEVNGIEQNKNGLIVLCGGIVEEEDKACLGEQGPVCIFCHQE